MSATTRYFPFIILLFLFGGCQKPDPPPILEQVPPKSHPDEPVNLSVLCNTIEKNMLAINSQRTTFALEQINQDLKLCLPLSTFEQQKHLLLRSNQMYKNFLTVDRTAAQQAAFDAYVLDLAQHPTIQQAHFEQLNPRDQYLFKHKGQAYIDVFESGNGQLKYRRSPEYLAKIFAPYMPEAEQVFIENLAAQNIQPVFTKNRLMIEPHEIAIRALFWENYLIQYPQSSYRQDAKYLSQVYSLFLFQGLSDAADSAGYIDELSIPNSTLDEIKQLATLKNSHLAFQAQKFIQFLQLSEEQRLKEIPVRLTAQERQSKNENLLSQKQLQHYLGLKNVNLSEIRDCFSDAICL